MTKTWLSTKETEKEKDASHRKISFLLCTYVTYVNFQVDGSLQRLLKTGRDFEDTLLAAVIRNLKIVRVCELNISSFIFIIF